VITNLENIFLQCRLPWQQDCKYPECPTVASTYNATKLHGAVNTHSQHLKNEQAFMYINLTKDVIFRQHIL